MNFVQQKQLLIWNRESMNILKSQDAFPFSKSCCLAVHEELAQKRQWQPAAGRRMRGAGLPSDPGQLVPQTGWEDAFHLLHDKV